MKKKKRITFANAIIIICLIASAIITASVIYESHVQSEMLSSGTVSALLGFWGGELLIIALRQIFGSDAIRSRSSNISTSDSDEGTL